MFFTQRKRKKDLTERHVAEAFASVMLGGTAEGQTAELEYPNSSSVLDEVLTQIISLGTPSKEAPYVISRPFSDSQIRVIEGLIINNELVSKGHFNSFVLANTAHSVYLPDSIKNEGRKKVQRELLAFQNKVKIFTLINTMFSQLPTYGSVCVERVPSIKTKAGLENVIAINPSTIFIGKEGGKSLYYQRVQKRTLISKPNLGKNLLAGEYIKLKDSQISYQAQITFGTNPYGVPMFMPVLTTSDFREKVICHIENIVKKLGIMGFLTATVAAPAQNVVGGEEDSVYKTRIIASVKEAYDKIKRGVSSGIVVGVKGVHDFAVQNTSSNASGLEAVFDLVQQRVILSLKQDPLLFGKGGNMTETLARISLALNTAQVENAQKVIAEVLREIYVDHLTRVFGYDFSELSVEFSPSAIADNLRIQQAEQVHVDTLIKLYNQGIIDNFVFARELGFDAPSEDEPRIETKVTLDTIKPRGLGTAPKGANVRKNPSTKEGQTSMSFFEVRALIDKYKEVYNARHAEFDYTDYNCGEHCNHTHQHFSQDEGDITLEAFYREYADVLKEKYKDFVEVFKEQLQYILSNTSNSVDKEYLAALIELLMYQTFAQQFNGLDNVTKKYVAAVFSFYRADKEHINTDEDSKEGDFEETIKKFLAEVDVFYLKKFITDSDIAAKIKETLEKADLDFEDIATIDKFSDDSGVWMLEKMWKIDRIITTSVARTKNVAYLAYMHQVGITTYEISAVMDLSTCAYCRELDGKTFSVADAVQSIQNAALSGASSYASNFPFITTLFDIASLLTGLTGSQLQNQYGFHSLPAHAHCRCVIIVADQEIIDVPS